MSNAAAKVLALVAGMVAGADRRAGTGEVARRGGSRSRRRPTGRRVVAQQGGRRRAACRAGTESPSTVIGAGLIGAEVASTAAKAGAQVPLIDPVPIPLVPVGEELAEVLHRMHAAHGVQLLEGTPPRVTADGTALLVGVEQQGGVGRVAAYVVLSAIGIEVNTALARSAGLIADGGVEVGAIGLTSNPAVRAVGDGVRYRGPDGTLHRRSEHWEAAMLSGTEAACGLLGEVAPDRPPSWLWTDRYGVHVEAAGTMSAPGSTVLRPGEGSQRVTFRQAPDGRLVGCATIDGGKVLRAPDG